MKILITGTCNLCSGNAAWKSCSSLHELVFGDYNTWSQVFLDPVAESSGVDLVVWVVCLEDMISPHIITELESESPGAHDILSDEIFHLSSPLASFLGRPLGIGVVVAWAKGEQVSAIQSARQVPAWEQVSRAWEERLRELQNNQPRLLLLPLLPLFARLGLASCFDPRNFYFAHCHFSFQGLKVLADGVAILTDRLQAPPRKVLALDCDGTLWAGIVGEDGLTGIQVGEDGVGKPFQDFQKVAKRLATQGVLLVIVSKNNESDVWEVFEKHAGMCLQRKDFVGVRINWQEKNLNFQELSAELGLGLSSFVFWDDNPMEREKIRTQIPEILVPEVPRSVVEWPSFLQRLPDFHRFNVTPEDQAKQMHYRARAQFQHERQEATDHGSFLASLRLQPTAVELSPTLMARAEQLCAKTNQFNLRSIRHDLVSLERMTLTEGNFVFLVNLNDRYGDHGRVGLVVARLLPQICAAFLDTFLLSCRVLGRHLEAWMLAHLIKRLKDQGIRYLIAEYIPTQRNAMASEFLPSHGLYTFDNSPFRMDTFPMDCGQGVGSAFYWANLQDLKVPHMEIYCAQT